MTDKKATEVLPLTEGRTACIDCGQVGVVDRRRCPFHARIDKMRRDAKWRGRAVPPVGGCENLWVRQNGLCDLCKIPMRLDSVDRKTTATLQHDQSGLLRLLCYSCNSRHARFGDAIYQLPPGLKPCPKCRLNLPLDAFGIARGNPNGRAGRCLKCRREDRTAYRRTKGIPPRKERHAMR